MIFSLRTQFEWPPPLLLEVSEKILELLNKKGHGEEKNFQNLATSAIIYLLFAQKKVKNLKENGA
jgi:hypothetical protein